MGSQMQKIVIAVATMMFRVHYCMHIVCVCVCVHSHAYQVTIPACISAVLLLLMQGVALEPLLPHFQSSSLPVLTSTLCTGYVPGSVCTIPICACNPKAYRGFP